MRAPTSIGDNPVQAAIEHEMLSEAASTHGRLLQKLNKALASLTETDQKDANYEKRVAVAGEALWYLVIQRDIMGFRNTNAMIDEMEIPAAVRLAMGPRRSQ